MMAGGKEARRDQVRVLPAESRWDGEGAFGSGFGS